MAEQMASRIALHPHGGSSTPVSCPAKPAVTTVTAAWITKIVPKVMIKKTAMAQFPKR